ncbi:hypothetical protein [Methylobacterium brachythecii]|uniref:Uncharacterized protein n=1 Tax=Methylobacterium brachythecii TaxID=1176177 RepID=A0A7W6AKQ9_9HYPH|nr:hypothetical protein [Methylobacterium brachythecii]MBB3905258.1 hypothetical protein [Methylobacterium brachythecii]GLS45969.1 hypothetical protein GCM10007884_39600 [Methylobacterium brachythecii]
MKVQLAAMCAVVMLVGMPVPPAMAFGFNDYFSQSSPRKADRRQYLGVHDGPNYERCRRSSAAEGNANQQTRPVKQYGQTSGGPLC